MNNIHACKLGENEVLGFDSGLNAKSFAQARMSNFVTHQGCIVYPDGNISPWKVEGVTEESNGNMVFYGPAFPGENLMALFNDPARKEEALDAVRFWINAQIILDGNIPAFPGAAGAFIVLSTSDKNFPRGTILFPPERIVRRCIEAEGDEEIEAAQQWAHPDLSGRESAAFSAAAMLYAIFCGSPPFKAKAEENLPDAKKKTESPSPVEFLRQDIREAVFLPPELAAPGLDMELSLLIKEALGANLQKTPDKKRPKLETLSETLGKAGSRKTVSWFRELNEEENQRILREREQYVKSKSLQVKTRRFVVRNTTLIAVCAVLVLVLVLGIQAHIKNLADRPNTIGMSPVEVVETYYGAFGELDHMLMEACVINKAGKDDINMVMNLFVLTRARQAYEASSFSMISAQQWLDEGSPGIYINVFGITNLKTTTLNIGENSEEVNIEAEYILWVPAGFFGDENDKPLSMDELTEMANVPRPPQAFQTRDRLKLVMRKDAWRISEITRIGR